MKRKWYSSLLIKFALIFLVFTLIEVVFSGVTTYLNQVNTYKMQSLQNISGIGDYLQELLVADGKSFQNYQNYYIENYAKMNVPADFSEDQTISLNSSFKDSLSFYEYLHKYYLLAFEKAKKAFNIPYAYYLVPQEENFHVLYVIDGKSSLKDSDGNKSSQGQNLYLGENVYNDPKDYSLLWKTWFTGEKQDDFELLHTQRGRNYAYYTPVIIDEKKMGLIGIEMEVVDVRKSIFDNTLKQTLEISLVLILLIALLLIFINKRVISKIIKLEANIIEYSAHKNTKISKNIKAIASGNDEIDSLAKQFAKMIVNLEDYMKNLAKTSRDLQDTKQWATENNVLANKDSLTGVRNKVAFENQIKRLEWQLSDGHTDFGFVIIRLKDLKKIYSSEGNEKGDSVLKNLCTLICHVFSNSLVFRIESDSFLVILEKDDFVKETELIENFNKQIKETAFESSESVTTSLGLALYNPKEDKDVLSVYSRAEDDLNS